MFGTDMNEMDVQAIDLGDELWQGVKARLDLAPVVVGRPIAGERLRRRELHALRRVGDRFALRPLRGVDAPAQVDELLFRKIDGEGTDRVPSLRRGRGGSRGCRGSKAEGAGGCGRGEDGAP